MKLKSKERDLVVTEYDRPVGEMNRMAAIFVDG
jgi:hypothetical protein